MEQNQHLDKLKEVRRVKAPEHLKAMIDARIRQDRIPRGWMVAASIVFALLLAANLLIINQAEEQPVLAQANDIESFAESLHLTTSNQLYYE